MQCPHSRPHPRIFAFHQQCQFIDRRLYASLFLFPQRFYHMSYLTSSHCVLDVHSPFVHIAHITHTQTQTQIKVEYEIFPRNALHFSAVQMAPLNKLYAFSSLFAILISHNGHSTSAPSLNPTSRVSIRQMPFMRRSETKSSLMAK